MLVVSCIPFGYFHILSFPPLLYPSINLSIYPSILTNVIYPSYFYWSRKPGTQNSLSSQHSTLPSYIKLNDLTELNSYYFCWLEGRIQQKNEENICNYKFVKFIIIFVYLTGILLLIIAYYALIYLYVNHVLFQYISITFIIVINIDIDVVK